MGLNDAAWESLFDKYHILAEIERNGQFVISANQIKEFREPRLSNENSKACFLDFLKWYVQSVSISV